MIKIALIGFGTVGKGTYKILEEKKDEIKKVLGKKIKVEKIMKRNLNFETELPRSLFTDDFTEIMENEEIELVVEMTGNIEEAYQYIKKSLESKKHIVTANKALVSKYFEEFNDIAKNNNVNFLYEASVCASIPIIESLKRQTIINDISKIRGILNGTGNYILYNMTENGISYDEALEKAQGKGYAEANPYDDVEGIDALRKLRILSTIAYKAKIENEDIAHYGLSTISKFDIDYFKEKGKRIKIIAQSQIYEDKFMAIVEPVILDRDDLLAKIPDVKNSIEITGENYSSLLFTGEGAGMMETGNAMVTDIIEALRGGCSGIIEDRKYLNDNADFKSKYYIRMDNENNIFDEIAADKFKINGKVIVITKEVSRKRIFDYIDDNMFVARVRF